MVIFVTRTAARNEEPARKPTNTTLPEPLLAQARDLRINMSQACERGLAEEVRRARQGQWLEQNRAALDARGAYFEANDLPPAACRQF